MGELRLGKLFGVRIGADWSLLVAFWLVTVSLAAGTFPAWHPDWSEPLRWGVAVAAALLFFASVLLHELSHALVGRAFGLDVRNITLFIFGGIANVEREPDTPRAELWMAAVGPLTSILLGLVFLFTGAWLADVSPADPALIFQGLGPAATLLLWLGPVNLLLGLFNLLPGFPLDGGRIFRALLWFATGDLAYATRWATRVGQVLGLAFVALGVMMIFGAQVPFFGTGLVSGLWLAFIGWFLTGAAAASYRQLVISTLLTGIPVDRLIHRDLSVVAPDLPLERLVDDLLIRSDQRAFPVIAGGRLVGLVCLEDVRKVPRAHWSSACVGDVMTPAAKLTVVGPRDDLSDAVRALGRLDVEQLPVVVEGRLIGVLRRRDVLRWLDLQSLDEARHPVVQPA